MNGKCLKKELSKELSTISVNLVNVSDYKSFLNVDVKCPSNSTACKDKIKSIIKKCMNNCGFSPYWSISVNIVE